MDYLILIAGIALVLWGADKLTDGSTGLARRFRVPDLVIGLTVVAFGTSLPEFITSFTAALKGSSAISISNIVGSNIFNTLLIVGASALTYPIWVSKSSLTKDIPFSLLAAVVFVVMCLDQYLGAGGGDYISRGDGMILLCFFMIFMYYTFSMARKGGDTQAAEEEHHAASQMPYWRIGVYIVLGLACLIWGGNLFVSSSSAIAASWGVSERVIGLTLVAGGTSLPELATSVVAARKGRSAIAIGNVIGSNIFNVFFVMGACATISPMPAGTVSMADLCLLVLSILLLWGFAATNRNIARWEGALLMLVYFVYMGVYIL